MSVVQNHFLDGLWQALGVWFVLIALTASLVTFVLAPLWREQAFRFWVRAAAGRLRRVRFRAEARRLHAHARRASERARLAATARQERRAAWWSVERNVDAAWSAFEAADADARRVLRAYGYGLLSEDDDGDDVAARRRVLRRLATEARARGDLSIRQLSEVRLERDPWDPRRPLADLETMLRCAIRDHRWHLYRRAAAAEREAWHEAESASETTSTLMREAVAAAAAELAHQPQRAPYRGQGSTANWQARPYTVG